ncbi:MAG TPA: pilin [Candidatus Paceibacterota bacterium]
MKKYSLKLSFLVISLSLFLLPSLVFAAPAISFNSLAQTSVILKASGLTAAQKVTLYVINKSGTTAYSKGIPSTADQNGYALATFTGLKRGGNYYTYIFDSTNKTLAQKDLKTLDPQLNYTNVSATSVTLKATNYEPNQNLTFRLKNVGETPYFLQTLNKTANTNGTAEITYTGLTPGGDYKGEVLIGTTSDKIIQFKTQTPPPPSGGGEPPSGGNEPPTGGNPPPSGSNVEPGWYYQMNDAQLGTGTAGPFATAEACQNSLDSQVANHGSLILKDCYEVTTQSGTEPPSSATPPPGGSTNEKGWYFEMDDPLLGIGTAGPFATQGECKTSRDLQVSKGATITKECYERATTESASQSDLSSTGGGLVPDCPETGCGWDQLMLLVAKVIDFLVFYLSLPIAAIAFAYAGFLLMTSGDNSGKRDQAKEIFRKVGLGLVIAMAAWLIVSTILTTLVDPALLDKYSLLKGIL